MIEVKKQTRRVCFSILEIAFAEFYFPGFRSIVQCP